MRALYIACILHLVTKEDRVNAAALHLKYLTKILDSQH
jgi:hypothetical protein